MGQKVNPIGLRVGIVEDWRTKWFASKKDFKELLKEDIFIRNYIKGRYPRGTIGKIEIQKVKEKIKIILHTPRPGVVLGRKGSEINMESGVEGIKVRISGRIGGVEIARSEQYIEGKVPLHTLRAKIDYATSTAFTRSGTVGVKVWLYLGEVLEEKWCFLEE